MHTLPNFINHTVNNSTDEVLSYVLIYSSSSSSPSGYSSTVMLICILSILCFFGVIFMIFGPMMRSESMKRVENLIFGRTLENQSQGLEDFDHYDI